MLILSGKEHVQLRCMGFPQMKIKQIWSHNKKSIKETNSYDWELAKKASNWLVYFWSGTLDTKMIGIEYKIMMYRKFKERKDEITKMSK